MLRDISSSMDLVCASMLVAAVFASVSSAAVPGNPSTFFSGDADDIQDYLEWVVDKVDYKGAYYMASDLDKADGAAIHWNIDEEQGFLELAVVARATGWLGFGISDNGGMLGSDMLIFEAFDPSIIKDAHVTDNRYPELDDCPSSWEFVSSSTETDFLIVEMRRKLQTQDNQDWDIVIDPSVEKAPQRILAAWGDEPFFGYHGTRNARSAIRWYSLGNDMMDDFRAHINESTVSTFTFFQDNYRVPHQQTRYIESCITAEEIKAQGVPFEDGVAIIGLEAVVTSPWVHHYTLFGMSDRRCGDSTQLRDQLYSWAPGEPPLIMPQDVGITAGGEEGYKSFIIEYHYNNIERRRDLYDSSGIIFHYSTTLPKYETAMIKLGDPLVKLINQEVGQGLSGHVFECQAGCTQAFLKENETVTVFREKLHMHKSGHSMFTEHYRTLPDGKGTQLFRTAKAQFFDFDQQGSQTTISEPYEIKAGDSFKTGCFYMNNDEERVFGFGSADEMCIHFLFYYPKKNLNGAPFGCGVGMEQYYDLPPGSCEGTHERVQNANDIEHDLYQWRTFGEAASTC